MKNEYQEITDACHSNYNTSMHTYHRFVILKAEHWQQINGATQPISFPNWPLALLSPASFEYAGIHFVAADYEQWKQKMLKYQQMGGTRNASKTD